MNTVNHPDFTLSGHRFDNKRVTPTAIYGVTNKKLFLNISTRSLENVNTKMIVRGNKIFKIQETTKSDVKITENEQTEYKGMINKTKSLQYKISQISNQVRRGAVIDYSQRIVEIAISYTAPDSSSDIYLNEITFKILWLGQNQLSEHLKTEEKELTGLGKIRLVNPYFIEELSPAITSTQRLNERKITWISANTQPDKPKQQITRSQPSRQINVTRFTSLSPFNPGQFSPHSVDPQPAELSVVTLPSFGQTFLLNYNGPAEQSTILPRINYILKQELNLPLSNPNNGDFPPKKRRKIF